MREKSVRCLQIEVLMFKKKEVFLKQNHSKLEY